MVDHKGRPYDFIDEYDAMDVVGHDDKFIHRNRRELIRQFIPPFHDHPTRLIPNHLICHNVSEQACTPLLHDDDKKSARLGVIISFQTDGLRLWMEGSYFIDPIDKDYS